MAKTILLADDSITIQKIVNLTFSGEGIDVVTVSNGEAALKKVNEIHPDVVLADIFMPGKNGYELCEIIKNTPNLQHIPVILLVGAFEPFDGNEAKRVKADGHLTKPFEIKVLISAVNSLIAATTEVEAPEEAKVEPELPAVTAVPRAEEVTEPTLGPVEVEPPIMVEERPQKQAESVEGAEVIPGPAPVAVEQQAEVASGSARAAVTVESEVLPEEEPEEHLESVSETELVTEQVSKVLVPQTDAGAEGISVVSFVELPRVIEERPLERGTSEEEPSVREAAHEPPLETEPLGIEPEVHGESQGSPELKIEVTAQAEAQIEVGRSAPGGLAVSEEAVLEAAAGTEASVREGPEVGAMSEEQVATASTAMINAPVSFPRAEGPAIELEEADPLGLYAADSVFAPIRTAIPDVVPLSSKSLVVDIWESKDILAASNDVLPELTVDEGISITTSELGKKQVFAAAQEAPPVEELIPETGTDREDVAATATVESPAPEFPVQKEETVFEASSVVSAESSRQTGLPPAPTGLDDPILIDRIVNKVVERLSKDAVERIAWEVVPDLAEIMIKEYVQSHFGSKEDH